MCASQYYHRGLSSDRRIFMESVALPEANLKSFEILHLQEVKVPLNDRISDVQSQANIAIGTNPARIIFRRCFWQCS